MPDSILSQGPAGSADPRIAVLIPCLDEAATIAAVVKDMSSALPGARIIVGDNGSTDATATTALAAGAEVITVPRRGKGAVLRALFHEVDADAYVLIDGDDTYPAHQAHLLLRPILDGTADMVVGDRITEGQYARENKRAFHGVGNFIVVGLINTLFRCQLRDILSGYRAFTRRFVKNCPILVDGFTVETVITLHALDKLYTVKEVPIAYRDRPPGSHSKLSTFRDGFLVLRSILWIFKDSKPLIFFLILSSLLVLLGLAGLVWSDSSIQEWLAGLVIVAGLVALACGLVLDTIVKLQRENYEAALLRQRD